MATRSSKQRTQEIKEFIVENVSENANAISKVVSEKFQISRQAAHRHVNELVIEGILVASGETKDRSYSLKPIAKKSLKLPLTPSIREDIVWREQIKPLLENAAENVINICQYGFTEMLNNAVEHSNGTTISIGLEYTSFRIKMIIRDNGIGIFKKVTAELRLNDEREAILELAKGKFTTDPQHHSGEGIFFTSRAFDEFDIVSGTLLFSHTEPGNDWLLEDETETKGTTVFMNISPKSDRILQSVFDKYTSSENDYGFTRTIIPVKLTQFGGENLVSRSQAKRLLARFEKFQEVILDFADIETIGQAFADEIFRVFAKENPQVHLSWENAGDQVEKMILRAKTNNV